MTIPHLKTVIECLQSDDIEVKFNAAAYLQHVTYHNEDNKELVRKMEGIPALISMLTSKSSTCQFNAACVLRNLSHGNNQQIKNQMLKSGVVEVIEYILDHSHQLERRLTEVVMAILCNLSCKTAFQLPLVNSALVKVVQCVLLPFLGVKINLNNKSILPFKYTDLAFTYTSFLEYITAFIKNLSSGSQYIRQQLRHCLGLIDGVVTIIQHGHSKGHFDSTIVENCVCIIRNLCYALQEVSDPDYLRKKLTNGNAPFKNGNTGHIAGRINNGSNSSKEILLSPKLGSSHSRHSVHSGVDLLMDDDLIDILLLVINDCVNYSTVEAAIGAVQNLAACDWHLADQFRHNFRKKKGLPSLVIQLNNGPDKVIKVALAALRNLSQDDRNLDLVGKHCLYHLMSLLPSQTSPFVIRRVICGSGDDEVELPEEYLCLDTIYSALSLIYFILKSNPIFCKEFVEINGVRSCMYLLRSDTFYKEHLQKSDPGHVNNGDQIPVLAANILQMLYAISDLGHHFKREKWTCEDFCVQSMTSELKSNLSCNQKNAAKNNTVYYGKPYIKARANALLPWTFKLHQRPTAVSNNNNSENVSLHRNSTMPNFFIDSADDGESVATSYQREYDRNDRNIKTRNKSSADREDNRNGNQRRKKTAAEY